MTEATKNENPSPPIKEIDPNAPAEPTETKATFKDDPEKIRGWITYLRSKGTKAAAAEIEEWETRLTELGEVVTR